MNKARAEIDAELDKLAAVLPPMLETVHAAYVMDVIASETQKIESAAALEDKSHVRSRIQCMLRDFHLIPGDDEPCSG